MERICKEADSVFTQRDVNIQIENVVNWPIEYKYLDYTIPDIRLHFIFLRALREVFREIKTIYEK